MIQTTYGTQYFVKWLFSQNERWLSANGEWHLIDEMHKSHALNACIYLQRTVGDVYEARFGRRISDAAMSEWLLNTPTFKALKERVLDEGPSYI